MSKEQSDASAGPLLTRFLLATVFCTFISLIIVLAILLFTPITEILISHTKYVATEPFAEFGQYEQLVAQRMLREKTLITVDALWSMQVSFYQTIMSILVGLNAAILGVAFFIIRASSKAEATRETAARFDDYTNSGDFAKLVQRKAKKEISKINATYGDVWDKLESQGLDIDRIDRILQLVTARVAVLDTTEDDSESSDTLSG
ncbi:hypothetical protein [Pseudomonas sp. UBA6310]|uniref:hypothetical protein n=1 Tax=Pseudomonas sp. UBA6310 TaxID=1947327 RepID=UPI00257F2FFC|nr:hypothetical protein [Pseudomonas sp. UBA6310]